MIRIAITGPESTGKTRLAEALADLKKGIYIPEFAREYLETNGPEYVPDDLDIITRGHAASIEAVAGDLIVVDTDFVVLKVWSEYKFEKASALINRKVSENWFDLHILCAPDIPWEEDVLRENPLDRDILFERYVEVLEKYKKEYLIVEGPHEKRLKKASAAVEQLERNP